VCKQNSLSGTLYGVGVGPGAPDLLTLRAVNVLAKVDAILAAASPRNDYSTALNTVRTWLRPDVQIVRLEFPMTRQADVLRQAWREAARRTLETLNGGKSAAFLTVGDPLIYSTFGYLLRTLKKSAPHVSVEIVPGVASFQAAAARAGTVLCEGRQSLRLIPGINSAAELTKELTGADTVVILKAYRNIAEIHEALRASGRDKTCLMACHVEQPEEHITLGLSGTVGTPPYMSLIVSRKDETDGE
jgi:precorrin-2/cobalt-factor-2 C20-methyltransferase